MKNTEDVNGVGTAPMRFANASATLWIELEDCLQHFSNALIHRTKTIYTRVYLRLTI